MRSWKWGALLVFTSLLAACGGSDARRPAPTPTATVTVAVPTPTVPPVATLTPTRLPTNTPPRVTNVRALHDPGSDQYNPDCVPCHAEVVEEHSLNPQIAGAHPAMFPFVGGQNCDFCHWSVDFDNRSAGNVRRNTDVELCALCHSETGAGPRGSIFYAR